MTGGAGFIGSHVVDHFHNNGHRVFVVDDLSSGSAANLPASVELLELDISSDRARTAIAAVRPDVVVHAAAQPSVAASTRDPLRDASVNVAGTINVLRAAADAGSRRIVYLNTGGALYGETDQLPTPESAPVRPVSPYGLSKWTGEQYLWLLAPRGSITVSLRLANVYGPRQSPIGEAGVVAIFVDRMRRREHIEIHGDGLQTRDFIYVADVVDAVARAVRAAANAAVNIGTGTETTILGLYELLAGLTDYAREPEHTEPRPGDVRRSSLYPRLAGELLGWRAVTELESGLRRTLG